MGPRCEKKKNRFVHGARASTCSLSHTAKYSRSLDDEKISHKPLTLSTAVIVRPDYEPRQEKTSFFTCRSRPGKSGAPHNGTVPLQSSWHSNEVKQYLFGLVGLGILFPRELPKLGVNSRSLQFNIFNSAALTTTHS